MGPKDRQSRIAAIIRQRNKATVEELAQEFSASAETIRRDLTVLAEAGIIQKIHGGAKLPKLRGEGSYQERLARNTTEKRAIAQKAAQMVSAGDTVFMDTGSTTLCLAQEIAGMDGLTIITNSAEISSTITARNSTSKLYLVGGEFNSDNQQTFGPLAIAQIRGFHAHHAILTVSGVDASAGITDFNIEEAHTARAMIEQAENTIVLADSSKFNQTGAYNISSLDMIDCLVTDKQPIGELQAALESSNVRMVF